MSASVEEAQVVSHTSMGMDEPMTEKNYRRLLRQASSYASFQLPNSVQKPKTLLNSGKPYVCMLIILVCAIMMTVEIAKNDWKFEPMNVNPTLGPSAEVLLELGAKRTDLILQGDWYRLIAPMFLHAGIIHFLFNMIGIFAIGFPLEREFGSVPIIYVFLCSGLIGVVISAIFSPLKVGVGASGGIFGLFGSAWAEFILNFSLYKGQRCRTFLQLFIATAFNMLLGLVPFLDNFAHIGGFMTGVITGFGVLTSDRYTRFGERKERKTYQIALTVLSMIFTPILLVLSLCVLYLGVDGREWCPGCSYLTCVPFPPGDSPWWTCDPCTDGGVSLEILPNATALVTCPDLVVQSINGIQSTATYELAIELCQEFCAI